MKLKYAVVSSNSNKNYMDLWPYISQAWKRIGIEPILLYIDDQVNIKYHSTTASDLDNLKDTDDARPLIMEYHNSNPVDGWFRRYWSNGNLRYEWEYKDGKRVDGISKGWWPNGNIKIIRNWVNGKHKGLQQEFYTNGKIWLEEMVTDDKEYGEFVEYDKGGKIMNEGKFRLEYLVDGEYGASVTQPMWNDNKSF